MSGGVRVERRGTAAVVVLDRPDRMNSLSRESVRELGRVGRELAGAPEVRAVVLTGAGDRAFCAGADLKERTSMNEPEVLELLGLYRTELGWLETSSVPTIAAINGVALGGGLELALLCDLRVATATATLALPETSLGIIPGAGGTQRLPRIVGIAKAKEMILLGTRLDAERALAIGLVHRVVPREQELLAATLAYIEPILSGAPLAQAAALDALRAAEKPLSEGLAAELAAYERCLVSEDRREALLAFKEKRKPNFRGH